MVRGIVGCGGGIRGGGIARMVTECEGSTGVQVPGLQEYRCTW